MTGLPPIVDCPSCDGNGELLDHINYWGVAETKTCALCAGFGAVRPDTADWWHRLEEAS